MRRIAVRCRKANGHWGIGVLISTLSPVEVLILTQVTTGPDADPATVLLAYVYFYDQRGGGVETSFKGDNQGLGSTKRSKKRFEAQHMVMLLGTLAHNVVIWARQWLTEAAAPSKLRHYGILRMVRDVFHESRLSRPGCLLPHRPDCAEPGGTFGTHLSRFIAGATGTHPRRH